MALFFGGGGVLSHVWLFVTPWTVVCPGSSVHEISQARIVEWVAISFSREMAVVVTGKESESESHSVCGLFATPWTIHEFSRPEYGSREPFLSPGDLPNLGIQARSPALQADSLPAEPQGKPKNTGVGSLSLLQQIFPTQELNRVSCFAGGFLTNFLSRTFCLFLTTASTLNSSDFQLTAILFSAVQWSIIVQQSNQIQAPLKE